MTPPAVMNEICAGARAMGVRTHLDGARIFNAAAYLGCDVKEIAAGFDTVMFCLSKGLCAPVGSMVAGSRAVIDAARLYRKRLGGGMRQAGVLAAAGLIALEKMPARLGEDHANAKLLAEGLSAIPGIAIDPNAVQTNILILDVSGTGLDAKTFSAGLKARGVLANAVGPLWLRMVTHHDVPGDACREAIRACATVAVSPP